MKYLYKLLAVLLLLCSGQVFALSITLDGTRTVLTGTDCGIATYRFGTTATWNGTPLDLHVAVNSEDNDLTGLDCIYVDSGTLSVRLRDLDAADDVAFVDVTLTLVQQNTLTPVFVDRITGTGFDLDANGVTTGSTSTGTDDIYLSGPGASYLSGATNVTYSTGAFAGGHDIKMKGQASGNCSDSPTTPVPSCRASASWVGGTTNLVASISARFQNDNAYGQYIGTFNALRLLQLSLDDQHAEELLADTNDHGDALVSYGDARHPIVSLYTILGNGLASDNETAYQSGAGANGDDNDSANGSPNYDDEDAVKLNGADLQNQTITAGSSETLEVTTFGDGFLNGWIDYNRDGDFNDAGEKIANDIFINSTTVQTTNVPITIPIVASGGISYARFRFNKVAGLSPAGLGAKGEVEDYRVVIDPMQPDFNMVKTSDTATISSPGNITYTFEFTNTGNVDLTNLTLVDPNINASSLTGCPIATLAPGAVATCSGVRSVSQADIDSGTALLNTATPSATDPAGDPVTESDTTDNSTSTTVIVNYSMSLDKPAPSHTDNDVSGDISAGDLLTYTITATNTGTGTLTSLIIADPLITPGSNTCASVAPGSTCVLIGSYTVTSADVATGSIANTAKADSDQTPPTTDDETVLLPDAAHTIDKPAPVNADEDGSNDVSVGDTLNYTITATNSGTANLTNLVVSDNMITPSSTSCALVSPGSTCVLTGSYIVTAADVAAGSIDNTASAESDQTASSSDSETVPVPSPELSIDKPAPANADEDGSSDFSLGDTLTYTVTATNSGTATLTTVVVSDPLLTPASATCTTLAPGADCILTGTYVVTAADIAAGVINNTASADSDQTGPVDDSETVSVPDPAHTLDKVIASNADNDVSGDVSAGDVLTYTVTATNTGTAVLTNLLVSDPMLTPSSNSCASIVVGATCVLTGTYTVTAADVVTGSIDNTATSSSDQTGPVDDTETVSLPAPALAINKPAPTNADEDGSNDVSAGDTLSYTITATNTGAATLTNVIVSDNLITPSSNTCATVAPGATCVLTGTYVVTAADVSAGTVVNTATADSDQTDPVTDDETVTPPTPDLQIDKAAPSNADEDGSTDISVGDTLTYVITATNNGTSNLTNLLVSDTMLTPSSNTCATVAPGATCVLTGTYVVTAADVAAGSIVNTATADSDQTPPVDDTETVTTPIPSHSIDKTAPTNADEDSTADISVGDTLSYTITATNNGTATLTNMVVSDPMITPSSATCASVPPTGTCVLSGTYSVTAADVAAGVIDNTASAVTDQTPPVTDDETVVVPSPAHVLDKAAPLNADEDASGDVSEGDTLTYTITATNSGAATLTNLVVSDAMLTPGSTSCATVAPAATCVLTGTYTVTAADVAAGSIVNTATSDSDQTDPVDDTETVVVPTPAHTIDKAAPVNADEDGSSDVSAGDTLTYTITATNSGTAVLTNLQVTDAMLSPSSNACASVAPGATCVLTGTYVVTAADITAGSIVNTASSDSDQTDPLDDTETVAIPQPSHSIDKPAPTNADEDGSSDVSAGDTLTYTVTATNTGTATLTNLAVTDPMLSPSANTCATVAPGATCVLTGTYVVTAADVTAGTIDNTASSDSDQTDPLDDSQSVVLLQPDLTIDKPAPANADEDTSLDVSAGDTLTYTITATNSGTSTLTNVVLTDSLITPTTITCATVAPGGTCILIGTYSVVAADVVAGTIDNTASADSDQTAPVSDDESVSLPTPALALDKPAPVNGDQDGSGDVSVGDILNYTITATNTGTATLTNLAVSDPLITPSSATCASVASGATCVLTGSYVVTAADLVAGSIDNTASADSDQTSPVTDDESVPVPTPAHSIDKPAPTHIDADGSTDISAGDTLNYTITASNSGTATLTNLVVSDPMITPATITCASVAPGATCVLSGSYVVTAADATAGSIVNTASSESDQTDPLTDDETVVLPTPEHTLDKPAPVNGDQDVSGDVSEGDVLTYTITATNSGTATLTNLVVSDPLIVPTSATCASVAPGATCVLTGTYTVTGSDVAAGSIDNTASSESDQTPVVSDDESVPVPTPALAIDKPAPVNGDQDSSTDVSAGDVLTYTITATNSGTATLTNLMVSDPLILPTTTTCASVAPGGTCVLTGTYTVTAADVAAGAINNTATADSDQTSSVTDDETVPVPSPLLTIDKTAPTNADGDSTTDVSLGDVLTYTVTATNAGTSVLTNVVVNDPLLTPATNTCASVAIGATCVLTGTYTVTAADVTAGIINNTASADSNQTGPVDDSESVVVPEPSHILSKGVPANTDNDSTGDISAGDTLTYTITATNNGAAVLTNMVVSDPLITPATTSCATLAPGATCVLVGTYVVTTADVAAGVINNTASSDTDQTEPVEDSQSVSLDMPSHAIDKAAPVNADDDNSGDISAGDTLTYTVTATNNGAATLTNLVVSDPMLTPNTISCAVVAPGATCVLVGNYTVTTADVVAGVINNTASSDSDQTDPLDDTETVNLLMPSMTLDKPAPANADEDASGDASVGDTLTYTITATNNGAATLTNVVVSDPLITPTSITCASMATGATCVLVGTYAVVAADVTAGSIDNTAGADSDQTDPISDDESVPVPVPGISIDKPAPVNSDTDASGDISAGDVLTYTITATNSGAATLTNLVVSDPLITPTTTTCATVLTGATCVLVGTYTVTTSDVVAGSIDNTASADSNQTGPVSDDETVPLPSPAYKLDKAAPGNADEDGTSDVSAGDTLTYTITATNSGTATLTNLVVSDAMLTPDSNTCASVAPGATCVLTGDYTVTAADVAAGVIVNTATSDSDQTDPIDDTETVTLNGPSHIIDKSAPANDDNDGSTDISAGDTLTYTITATNNGTANLTNLAVSDPMITPNSINCALVTPGATCVLVGTYVVTAADVLAGTIDNTASSESDQTDVLTDDESVPLPTPAIDIDKPAPAHSDNDATGDISVGDQLTYTITATNSGSAVLTNMLVTDPMLIPNSQTCASVAPGATCVLIGSYTVVASDVSTGSIDNTASADSDQTDSVSDDETVSLPEPELSLDKAAPSNADGDSSTDVSFGDVLTYTVTATNSGTAVLTNVVVADPLLTPNTTTCASLAVGATCVLTGNYTVTAADVAAGVINNTATADTDQTDPISDSETVVVPDPGHTLNKAVPVNTDNDASGDISAGDTLTYTITATNNGTAVLTNLLVSDPLITPTSQNCASVAVGATCVLVGSYTVTAADVATGSIDNTATSDSDQTDPLDDSQSVNLNEPSHVLDKSAPVNADEDGSADISAGDTLTYTITASNNGAATLTNLVVNDPMITPSSVNCASVAPGASCVLVGTYVVTAADVTATVIDNTATAGSDQSAPTSDDESVPVPAPLMALDKSAPVNADEDGSLDVSEGDTLTYTITATNTGTATLTNLIVSDPLIAPTTTTCASVAPGAACVLIGGYTVITSDVSAGVINNTATASSDQTDPIDDSEAVPVPAPALAIDKPAPSATDPDGSTDLSAGDVLTYTITATNSGTATLTNLLVSDPMLSPVSNTCASVIAGGTCVLTGTYTVTTADVLAGVINNTASANSDQTGPVSDDESVVLPTPGHSLSKAVPSNLDEDGTGDVSVGDTLNYVVTATNTGTAHLTNLVVSDALITPNTNTCALVAPGGTCVLSGAYTVTAADVAAGVINNTATSDSEQTDPVDDSQSVNLSGPSHVIDKPAPVNADNDGSTDVSVGDTLTYTITATNNGSANLTNLIVNDPMLTPSSITCALVTAGADCVLIGTYVVTAADVAAGAIDNTASSVSDQTGVLTDDETVPVPAPALALDKSAPVNADEDGSSDVSMGDTLSYNVTATNSGTATLTNLVVADSMISPNSTSCALVAPGATCTLIGTYAVTAADVAAGSINNTATADSDQTPPTSDTENTPMPGPAFALDKAAPVNADEDGSTDVSIGDTLSYTITATNTGNANLTNLVISDPLITPNTTTCAAVTVGGSCVLSGTYVVQASDVAAGTIVNTASADSDQTDDLTDSENVPVPTPSHAIDKPAPALQDNDGSNDVSIGDVLTYTITATNTGTASLTNLVVSDPLVTPNSTSCALVAPGATCVLSGTYTVTGADVIAGTINNTASSDSDQTDPLDDDQIVNLPASALQIDKPAPLNADEDGSTDLSVGDTLTYSVTATNSGTSNLTNVVVSDPLITPNTANCALVAPAATCVLSGTYVVTVADVSAGTLVNTASADSDQTPPVEDTQTVTPPTPSHTLVKAAPGNADEDGSGDVSVGDTLTYVITATNNGTATLTNLSISDSMVSPSSVNCPVVAPGANCVLTGTYVVTAADVTAGVINNTATSDSDQTVPVDDTQSQNLTGPSHTLSKSFSANADEDGSTDISVGDTLTYVVTATNNGNASLTNLLVSDVMLTPSSVNCPLVAPGDNCVLTGTYVATAADVAAGSIDNTASSDSDQTEPLDDTETVVLPTPMIDISKAVPTNADEDGSGDITAADTLNYIITVTNNGTAVLTNVVINDSLITPSAQTCPLLTPGAVCVLNGSYSVTAADVVAGSITNTASVDSDQTGPATDDVVVNLAEPGLELVKALSGNADEDASGDISIGDTLTYTATATNTGATSLTNVLVNDAMLTPASTSCALVATGGTCVLSGNYVVTATDIAAGLIDNTATADSDQTEPVSDQVMTQLAEPGLVLDKALAANADEDGTGDISQGDTLTYTVVATNNGSSTLTMVSVTDNLITPDNIVCASLAPLSSCSLTGTYSVTAADVAAGVINNTATADSDQTEQLSDAVSLNLGEPSLSIFKSSPTNTDNDATSTVTPGDVLNYTVTATNTGGAVLTGVVINDAMLTPSSTTCATLTTGQNCVLNGSYTVTVADAANGSIVNTATADSDQTGQVQDTQTEPVVTPPISVDQPEPPVTQDNSETDQPLGQPVTVSVLDNDSDPENNIDPTTVMIIDPITGDPVTELMVPGEGTWIVDPVTGDITFTPEPGYVGDPTPIVYIVTDTTGLVSNPSTVTIDYEEPATLTGTVWLDSDRDGEIDADEAVKAGWTLEILDDQGNIVATVLTDANGEYSVTGLIPGEYTVRFYNEAGVFISDSQTNGPLMPGDTQDLPLPVDPSGVVYDSSSREPLAGVTLQLINSAGVQVDPSCLNANQQGQVTQADGLYAFDVFPDAHPSCPDGETYEIVIVDVPPTHLPGYSSNITPDGTTFDSDSNESNCTIDSHPSSGACEVQAQPDAPQSGQSTRYFTRFTLYSGDTNVIFNHIPVDPYVEPATAAMTVLKSVGRPTASTGDVLTYSVRVENTIDVAAVNVSVKDDLPRGFRFVEDSASVTIFDANQSQVSRLPVSSVGIDPVVFLALEIPPFGDGYIVINYAVRVGANVVQGDYANTAEVSSGGSSNVSTARVSVVADPVLHQATLVGKVFHDRDGDGYQEDAFASDVTIKSDYFGWSSYHAGDLSGRISAFDDPMNHSVVVNMPATDNNSFAVSTSEGTLINVDHNGVVTESHTGKRARGITGQQLRISTRKTEAAPTPTQHLQSNVTGGQAVIEITIENVGINEEGMPGVRLATVEGLLIETDQAGRFHLPDVDVGATRIGKQFIVKLDKTTLPEGAVMTTENPRVMRITNSALNTMRFGVRLPAQEKPAGAAPVEARKADIEARLGSVFFDTDMHNIRADQRGVVQDIIKRIRQFKRARIVIEAHTDARHNMDYNVALAERRARTVENELRKVLGDKLMKNVSVEVDKGSYQELYHNDPQAIDYKGDVQ